MIYGANSKGNYQMLSKIAKRLPVFPNIKNQRSMLYIGNLCMFIKYYIDKESFGIFFPQNEEYVNTSQMVKMIAKENGQSIYLTKLLNPFVYIASRIPGKIGGLSNKAFGNISYEGFSDVQNVKRLEDSIKEIVRVEKYENISC